MRLVDFDIRTPTTHAALGLHVSNALLQGLPEVQPNTRAGRATIIANGPTATRAPASWLDTFTVNGAIKLFGTEFWVGCDPQEVLGDFLDGAPRDTNYLIASKVHPSVFRKMEGHSVHLWHLDDYPTTRPSIMSAVSVTLCTLSLARYMGYTEFDVYGWDGCYIDGRDHAVSQPHAGDNITVHIGDKSFPTTTSWAAEAQDAVIQLSHADYTVRVHGPGMIGAILRKFELIEKVKDASSSQRAA